MISHIDQKFIDSRRAQLHDFLIKMSYVPGVLQSDTFLQWCGLAERDSGYALATEASAGVRAMRKLGDLGFKRGKKKTIPFVEGTTGRVPGWPGPTGTEERLARHTCREPGGENPRGEATLAARTEAAAA